MNALTIIYIVFIIAIVAICVYFGTMQLNKPVKYVDLLRPRDSRGQSLKVVLETDLSLECKKTDGITHHFIKAGPAWTYSKGGRMVTRFLGLEATPYTARIEGPVREEISQEDYLRLLWGDKFYSALPSEQKTKVEKDQFGVTVEVSRAESLQELPARTGGNIADEEEDTMLRRLTRMTSSSDKAPKMSLMTIGGLIALGAFAMYFLVTRGVI